MKRDMLVLALCLGVLCVSLAAGSLTGRRGEAAAAAEEIPAGHTLILDAGHGGEDGGAVSASGARESDVNLAVVLRLDQLMGLCGVAPVLTRDGDYAIYDKTAKTLHEKKVSDIRNRVALVNGTPNAVFLSVHQNSFTDTRYYGSQVFYGREEGSRSWGEHTQKVLRDCLAPENDRQTKQIPGTVYLMEHINCPALLVECGFLSNEAEAALLQTPEQQKRIAAALAGATLQYLQMFP